MDVPLMKPPLLFLSDAHLGGFSENENQRIENELINLIDYCQEKNIQIAILGDLFDYWMEYPNHVPQLGKQLLARFESFNNELGPTLYITGNHDNWTRNHLQQRGFFLEHECFTFQNGDKTIMTLHGDGLSDPRHSLQRPFMHRFLRSKNFIKIYQRLLPPKTGLTCMKYFSRLTRNYEWTPEKTETLNNWAEQKLQQSNIDIILSGHDHCPRKEQFPFGTYINLGTFYKHRTLAFYNDSDVTLVFWENKQKSLKPFNGIDE